jgi:twitching motility protein PilT
MSSGGFPLLEFLAEIAGQDGTTDVTLSSTGRVAVRRNTRLSVTTVEALGTLWRQMVAEHFPERGSDLRAGYTRVITGGERRYRATLTAQARGESMAVRPLSAEAKSPEELLLPEGLADYFLGLRGGLFLVGGPTGSGKSTTIASLLGRRRQSSGGKVVTIEDPIEFLYEDNERTIFEQREIGNTVRTYEEGLKEALHMNPDLISVQEIRESAAAETALSAALSGHLVVASIHAFTAPTAPQRYLSIINRTMEDLGARDALASCLEAVVMQRLVPGYEGLVPLFEVMLFREQGERLSSMERLVRQGNWMGLRQEIETGRRLGMLTWEESRRLRVEAGLIPAVN